MGTKATDDHIPEQPLLGDNTRWLPIEVARERLRERTNDTALDLDLQKALADGRLPCMVQSLTTGERKFVAEAAWTDPDGIMLDEAHAPTMRVVHHYEKPKSGGAYAVRPVGGCRFFVWLPYFDRIWPPAAGSTPVDHDDEPLRAIDRAKVALLHLYRTKAQMPGSLKEATRKVMAECENRGWKPPSEDRVQAAAEQLGYRPPRKRK